MTGAIAKLPAPAVTSSPAFQETANHQRLTAIDFAKGILVICMVGYHSLNYSAHLELGFRYFSFLPPSFILITGFLIGRVYFSRPATQDGKTTKRLIVRGAKLLVLFTALNIAAGAVSRRNYNGQELGIETFFDHASEIYFFGEGRWAVFDVLLPIAYLLLLGPVFLLFERINRWITPIMALSALIFFDYLERRGSLLANGSLLTAGVAGLVLARIPGTWLERLRRYWPICVVGYLICWWITIWIRDSFLLRMVASCAAIGAFFGIGEVTSNGWIAQRILKLGVYSLIAYIGQIAILQILSRWIPRPAPLSPQYALLFGGTLALTLAGAELADYLRSRSRFFEWCYRGVFN